MSSTYNGSINGAAGTGGAGTTRSPPRPHWRTRDPAATVVYVVHPDQFRDVVHQLTGAAPTQMAAESHACPYAAAPCTSTTAAGTAAALEQRLHDGAGGGEVDGGHEGGSTRTTMTLKQMMEECVAWATSDGYDENCGEGSGNQHGRG
jgi:hypothetical protein